MEPAVRPPAVDLAPETVKEIDILAEQAPTTDGIAWTTHLSPQPQKGVVLVITFSLLILAGLVTYFSHDIIFAIVLVLSTVVINLVARKPSKPSEINVHATGISIDNDRHHFADMRSFWVDYEPNLKEVRIEMKKGYAQRLKIPLEDTDPLQIRRALLTYMPEREHELSLLDQIIRLIGF